MKKAFTMLELVFVIVVIGVLMAVILPRTETNNLREAAIQVISDIRYTQHLAMVDDQYNASDVNWSRGRWQIRFGSSANTEHEMAYAIFLDKVSNTGTSRDGNPNITNNEIARDPSNPDKLLSGGWAGILPTNDPRATKKMNIGMSYDIASVDFEAGCNHATVKRLTFDYLGRPLRGSIHSLTRPYEANRIIQNRCEIVLTDVGGDSIVIGIAPETGYACILDATRTDCE